MSKEVAIRDLQAIMKQKEVLKHKLDKEIEALATVIGIYAEDEYATEVHPIHSSRPNSHSAELTGAIEAVLLEERPLHRRVILERVTKRGIYVGGEKPLAVLGSYLSMDRRFKNVGRGIWTLTDEPVAPAEPRGNGIESMDLLTLAGSETDSDSMQ